MDQYACHRVGLRELRKNSRRVVRTNRGFGFQSDQNRALNLYRRYRSRATQTLSAEMKSWTKSMRKHRWRDLKSLSLDSAELGEKKYRQR